MNVTEASATYLEIAKSKTEYIPARSAEHITS